MNRLFLAVIGLGLMACMPEKPGVDSSVDPRDSDPPIDADGDGFYADGPEGLADCDDSDPNVNPDAVERCDGQDEDCDGLVDEDASDAEPLHADADGDGYGEAASAELCPDALGYVEDGTDCLDSDAAVNPGATERCDDIDNDCDGLIDEDAAEALPWYEDADGDGYGDPDHVTYACDPASGQVDNAGDCDDSEPMAWSDAEDICGDGVDNDCDGGDRSCWLTGRQVLEDGDYHLYGHQTRQSFGNELAFVGDWTGDGTPDLVVGADSTTAAGRTWAGAIYLFEGGHWPGSDTSAAPLASAEGSSAYAYLGHGLDNIGDLDGDGRDEIAAGAIGAYDARTGLQPGITYIYNGYSGADLTQSARLFGPSQLAETGWTVRGMDDVDGDSVPDLAVSLYGYGWGTASYEGGVQLVSGADIVDGGDYYLDSSGGVGFTLWGEEGSMAGIDLATRDDVNGDGVPDLLMGDRGLESVAAWLVTEWPGSDAALDDLCQLRVMTDDTGDFEGQAVALPGDMDGDGYSEVAVGAMWDASDQSGAVYIFTGDAEGDLSLSDAWLVYTGEGPDANAGGSLDRFGDLDGDGLAELLVGSRGYDAHNGGAYLVSGTTTGTVSLKDAVVAFIGSTADGAGQDVRGVGDLDGDGRPEAYISASASYTTAGPGEGWIWFTAGR